MMNLALKSESALQLPMHRSGVRYSPCFSIEAVEDSDKSARRGARKQNRTVESTLGNHRALQSSLAARC
jgi:hypothetical protein